MQHNVFTVCRWFGENLLLLPRISYPYIMLHKIKSIRCYIHRRLITIGSVEKLESSWTKKWRELNSSWNDKKVLKLLTNLNNIKLTIRNRLFGMLIHRQSRDLTFFAVRNGSSITCFESGSSVNFQWADLRVSFFLEHSVLQFTFGILSQVYFAQLHLQHIQFCVL